MVNTLPVTLVLDNVRSLYNVGSIFRTADGVGINKIILSGITPYPAMENDARKPWEIQTVTEKLGKTALGAENVVSWVYEQDPLNAITKEQTITPHVVVSLEKTKTSQSLFDIETPFPIILVVGNEREGISQSLLDSSDLVVHLPMHGSKNSLNVSNATSIALYELRRKFNITTPR